MWRGDFWQLRLDLCCRVRAPGEGALAPGDVARTGGCCAHRGWDGIWEDWACQALAWSLSSSAWESAAEQAKNTPMNQFIYLVFLRQNWSHGLETSLPWSLHPGPVPAAFPPHAACLALEFQTLQ